MKIAVINLASQPARWHAVQRQFEAIGLSPERVEAIQGSDLPAQQRRDLYCERLNRRMYPLPLRPGEIGCYASHIKVWRQILERGERRIAIFEDDVEFDAELPALLNAIEQLPSDIEVVKLMGRHQEKLNSRVALSAGHDLVQYHRVPSRTGAYVLSRSGAEKLLSKRQPFGRPVDVDMRHWWECDLQIFGVQPYPVRDAPCALQSSIEGRHPRPDLGRRLHKLSLQAEYSMRNMLATLRRARAPSMAHGNTVRTDRPSRAP